jgi:hypothetical protein
MGRCDETNTIIASRDSFTGSLERKEFYSTMKDTSKKRSGKTKPKPQPNPNFKKIIEPRRPRKRKIALGESSQWLKDYPPELRGPPQNRFGGHKTTLIKPLRGSTFGPAGPCRKYSRAECVQVERELRAKGYI